MTITRLVIQFNKDKIFLGLILSIILITLSIYTAFWFSKFLFIFGLLILTNIILAIFASYQLYDKSNLYKPKELLQSLIIKKTDKAIFLHASFDPVSSKLEQMFKIGNLKIYNLYGNRHEDEKSIKISNKLFPPNPKQQVINPTNLPDNSNSIDYILAITSLHEILSQEKRIHFFKEANRILKDDGTLIICEQLKNWINFIFFNIGVFHFVSFNQWKDAIEKSNLKIEKVEKITPWGTMIFVKK